VYRWTQRIRRPANAKRALLIITDGEENHSRYTFSNLRDFVKEQNVQIFSIGATWLTGKPVTFFARWPPFGSRARLFGHHHPIRIQSLWTVFCRQLDQRRIRD